MTLQEHFASIKDFRQQHKVEHLLIDILILSIIAVICGATEYKEIEIFGKSKESFLKQFLSLPNGIPSHDTIERVIIAINPKEFHQCFMNWVKSLCASTFGELIAMDGKTSKGSYDTYRKQSPIHLVNAWSTLNGVVLGQYKVDDKSNEITALPKLLSMLQIEGCIISVDAMGCQKEIAKQIVEAKADYILALKANQETLQQEAIHLFTHAKITNRDEDVDINGNRIEIRKCTVLTDLSLLDEKQNWSNLNAVVRIQSTREVANRKTTETRYYISSLTTTAKEFNRLIRSHWQVENKLHWQLDVTFCEDKSRKRKGNSAENFSLLTKTALNIIRTNTHDKISLANKQYKAALNEDYLLNIIKSSCV
jgi:predicted transposase YbfD/YdcC